MLGEFRRINQIFPHALKKTLDLKIGKDIINSGIFAAAVNSKDFLFWSLEDLVLLVENPESTDENAVFPPHPESVYLSKLIPVLNTKNKNKFLDIGVGTGILSLIASKKGWEVKGVDINKRALELSKFNAKLNETQCEFNLDSLAYQENNKFDLCIANLPFEPTPNNAKNFKHSNGGKYGDDLIKKLIDNLENLLNDNGNAIVPCFSLIKNDRSRLEEYLESKKLSSAILRISKKIDINYLSTRFVNDRNVYKYLIEEGYSYFTIDIALIKKESKKSSFSGVAEIIIADQSWIMPSGWIGISQCD